MTDGRAVLETGWIIRAWIEKFPLSGENESEHQFEKNKLMYITRPQTDCFSYYTAVGSHYEHICIKSMFALML